MEQGKVLKLYDFRELSIPEQLFELSYSEAAVEQDVEAIREKFLTIEAVPGPVEHGDIVTLELPATETAEAGTLQINVGKNFYDNGFEAALAGLTAGAAVMLPRRDQGRSATLIQIKRRVFPPLSDDLVPGLGLEGVSTLDGYREVVRQKHIGRDKYKKSQAIMTMVLRDVAARSAFGDLTADVDKAFEDYKVQLNAMAEKNGMSYEAILEKAAPPKCETTAQRESYIRENVESQVQQRFIGRCQFEQDGKVLDDAGFKAFQQSYIDQGMDQGRVERELTYEIYCSSAPLQYYQDLVTAHYENRFKVVEKP